MIFYIIEYGILFRRNKTEDQWQVVIPGNLSAQIMECVHSKLGHPGVFKTLTYIKRYYYWKSMNQEIKNFVLSCDIGQRVKPINIQMEGKYRRVYSSEPGDLICVDFYGPLPRSIAGMEYIFVVYDAFSKYIKLYPIKKENTRTILNKMLKSYIPEMGTPRRILSDHGTQFTAARWGESLREVGIQVLYSSIRHPQGNPVERMMRELGRIFRTLCSDKHTKGAKYISDIEFFLNATTNCSTGFSPHELHFGEQSAYQIKELIRFPRTDGMTKEYKILIMC